MGKDIWDIKIYSHENSNEVLTEKEFNFAINYNLDFDKIEENLDEKAIVKDNYFVHFSKFYKVDDALALMSLTMGSFTKPLSIYLILKNNTISYFSNTPIPTSSNHNAHKLICQILNESLK